MWVLGGSNLGPHLCAISFAPTELSPSSATWAGILDYGSCLQTYFKILSSMPDLPSRYCYISNEKWKPLQTWPNVPWGGRHKIYLPILQLGTTHPGQETDAPGRYAIYSNNRKHVCWLCFLPPCFLLSFHP